MRILYGQALFIACSLALTSSCHNVRQYDSPGLRLMTRYWHPDEYIALVMGTPTKQYQGEPALLIRMSDSTVINTATVDVTLLESKCAERSDASGLPFTDYVGRPNMDDGAHWGDSTVHLQDYSREFLICHGRLCGIRIYQRGDEGGTDTPYVGDPRTGAMFAFPLAESTVVSLFGPPERFREYLHE